MEKTRRQFGLWKSPIQPVNLARGLRFSDVAWDEDGTLLWRESRSDLSTVVVKPPDGQAVRDLNSHSNIRAGVGNGGGDFSAGNGQVFFVEAESGRIYRQGTHQGIPQPITPSFGFAASPTLSPDGKNLLYVHTVEGTDSLGLIGVEGNAWPAKLVSGDDFYMQPCWHPDCRSIAWIAWNHPQMPWDGTSLYLGTLQDNEGLLSLGDVVHIVGGEQISVFQPQFSPDGRYLSYVADPNGWWQLHLYDLYKGEHILLTDEKAEYGIPAWNQGLRTYDFSPDGSMIYVLRNQSAITSVWELNLRTQAKRQIEIDPRYSWFSQIAVSPDGERLAMIASGGSISSRVITVDLQGKTQVQKRSLPENLSAEHYASPRPITWQGMDDEIVHGIFYSPKNPSFKGVELPPLMILIHGGPTSQRDTSFAGQVQFFTSRGWAVLQVNYRGSTGYGRPYRDMLRGNWGIYDVQDAVSGAQHFIDAGKVDGDKVVIMGGSAGGFTVLRALEDYPGFFKAGICLYGLVNLFSLEADAHKFEKHYSDSLLGSLPEAAEVYRERSPIFSVAKIQDPVAIFQGENDKVIPPDQAEEIVAALRRNGMPHEYHLYPGEGHGFRKMGTIEKFYTAVERFLQQYVIYS